MIEFFRKSWLRLVPVLVGLLGLLGTLDPKLVASVVPLAYQNWVLIIIPLAAVIVAEFRKEPESDA